MTIPYAITAYKNLRCNGENFAKALGFHIRGWVNGPRSIMVPSNNAPGWITWYGQGMGTAIKCGIMEDFGIPGPSFTVPMEAWPDFDALFEHYSALDTTAHKHDCSIKI